MLAARIAAFSDVTLDSSADLGSGPRDILSQKLHASAAQSVRARLSQIPDFI